MLRRCRSERNGVSVGAGCGDDGEGDRAYEDGGDVFHWRVRNSLAARYGVAGYGIWLTAGRRVVAYAGEGGEGFSGLLVGPKMMVGAGNACGFPIECGMCFGRCRVGPRWSSRRVGRLLGSNRPGWSWTTWRIVHRWVRKCEVRLMSHSRRRGRLFLCLRANWQRAMFGECYGRVPMKTAGCSARMPITGMGSV